MAPFRALTDTALLASRARWRHRPLLRLLLALLVAGPAAAQEPGDWLFPPMRANPDLPALRQGSPAPHLEWQTADGGSGSLAALRGEVVVVVFWASWCAWCRRFWPVLADVAARHDARPRVLAVNIWDEAAAAAAYVRRPEFPWPLLRADDAQAKRWQVPATPHSVVVDGAGRISGVISGLDPAGQALQRALDAARASPVGPP